MTLFCIFHYEHFNGLAAGHEFEAEFAERQVHRILIIILQIAFRAIRVFFLRVFALKTCMLVFLNGRFVPESQDVVHIVNARGKVGGA